MFILSFISSGFEFWSVYHTSIYKNSELKVFKSIKIFVQLSNNWPNDLFLTNLLLPIKSPVLSAVFGIALFEAVLNSSVGDCLAWSRSF